MKTLLILILTISTSISITFAQGSKPNTEGLWKIKSMKDSGKMAEVTTKENSILIENKTKKITVFVGCNRMSGTFEFVTGDIIKPIVLTSTRKACKGDLQGIEDNLRYVLEQVNSIRKNGARIEFFKDAELLMVLERPAAKKK